MGIDLVLKIAAVGVVVALLNQILTSNDRKEMAILCNIAGILIVVMLILSEAFNLFETIRTMFNF